MWQITEATLGTGGGIAVDNSNNVYFAGASSIGLRKINSYGSLVSTITLSSAATDLKIDASGNYYIGTPYSSVIKYSSSGTALFNVSSSTSQASRVAVDSSGNIYCTFAVTSGYKTVVKTDSNGNIIWSLTDVTAASDVAVDASGNVYVSYSNNTSKTVRKLNSSGTEIWSLTDIAFGTTIAVDASGNVYVGYTTELRKLNSLGVEVWHVALTNVLDITIDSADNFLLVVTSGLVLAYDFYGNELWGIGYSSGYRISANSNGVAAIAGNSSTSTYSVAMAATIRNLYTNGIY
jgi:hypothetical protein